MYLYFPGGSEGKASAYIYIYICVCVYLYIYNLVFNSKENPIF